VVAALTWYQSHSPEWDTPPPCRAKHDNEVIFSRAGVQELGALNGRNPARRSVDSRSAPRYVGLVPERAAMKQTQDFIEVSTSGRGLYAFTSQVARWLQARGGVDGLLTLFVQHTSASLLVQENADPLVREDLERFFARLVKDGDPIFSHTAEGPDDMPAHVRAALTQTQLSIPVRDGAMVLGTWQGLYLYEHRKAAHRRRIALHFLGTMTEPGR
jgi:secondary thiamine-phosphate synthase enzyme